MSPDTPQAPIPAAVKPTAPPAEPKLAPEPVAANNGQVNRASFLALVGELAEDTVEFTNTAGDTISVLVRELTGAERADLITLQAEAYQKGSLEIRKYEQRLMLAAVADPETPKGARMPLLKAGDGDLLMGLGASKVQRLVTRIEELSGMGAAALQRAEGNSVVIPSVVSTSG